ncbi:hypothetical protein ACHHYP_02245 [Achlya hypogyna]|uniref:Oxidoreductase n=1 Tax=Achlya hypogyna TaxID=1202772 RepID=A0A1V9ZS89_ACHHY|nr:hypothetical protein ACHHYP_02245 [Achlya hypogyna]
MQALPNQKLRVGLVGFGMAAQVFHLPLLLAAERFDVTHVLERTKEASRAVLPNARIVRSMAALVATDIDVVVIASPSNLHYEQAAAALAAKKHVVVDKPMCVTAAEADALLGAAAEANVVLTVFQNRRWDADFLTVRKLLAAQTLGKVHHFEAHYDRYRPALKDVWREDINVPGSGLVYDLGAHLVDQMLVLFGPPTSIHADVQSQRKGYVNDDYFRFECTYPGLSVVLTAGMLVKEPTPKYTIRGENGTYIKFGEDGQEAALKAGRTPKTEGGAWGVEPESLWGHLQLGDAPAQAVASVPGNYDAFYTGLADTIQLGTPLLVRPEESAAVIRFLEAAKATFLETKQ